MERLLAAVGVTIALSIPGSLAGPAADKIAQREPEPYAGYSKACGFPILYARILTVSLARIDPRLGKVITLDPILTHPAQESHRRYLIAHECAHHLLEHTSIEGLKKRTQEKGVEDQELSADCWAAETLVAANSTQDAVFMADAFFRMGLYSPGSGYPSGVQRSTMIFHCLKSAQRRKAAAERDLPGK